MAPLPYMDARKAPLNPCSLETIQTPVELADGRRVWPLMLSCYQLDDDGSGQRRGHMEFYTIDVPDIAGSCNGSMPLQFGEPDVILSGDVSSGILDGKWFQKSPTSHFFATAHSNGEIVVHNLSTAPRSDGLRLDSDPLYTIEAAGSSYPPERDLDSPSPLCLSLNWNHPEDSGDLKIVSTYSNGTVAIHDVALLSENRMELIERDCWQAHTMFTSPAEVWSACFAFDNQYVLSCGDEGSLKCWDIRSTLRPTQVLKPFEAGVTCVAPHPATDYIVAVGSYDETVCLFDLRYLSYCKPLLQSKPLGGGIWRLKWHPYSDDRLLVAAMHGGCTVLRCHGLKSIGTQIQEEVAEGYRVKAKATKNFTEHESMAYGADWLVCRHPTQDGYFEAAASCSFYDKAVFIWDSVF